MKNFLRLLTGGLAALLCSSVSHALSFTDNAPNLPSGLLNSSNATFIGSFNILDSGYDPSTMVITSAKVYFAFADDYDSGEDERAKMELGSNATSFTTITGLGNVEVGGTSSSYDWYEFQLSDTFITYLQDGVLHFKVKLLSGDAYLKAARLEIEVDCGPPVTTAPDGSSSTVALFGVSVVGLIGLRRRFFPNRFSTDFTAVV